VPRISTGLPASIVLASASSIASEYASCPVEHPADQMRSRTPGGRDAHRRGNAARTCANGVTSRKKKLSLVVIASTTAMASRPFGAPCSRATNASSPLQPSWSAIGDSRLSSR